MSRTIITWDWQEAFDKFGFGDGDSWNGTDIVENFLNDRGWEVNSGLKKTALARFDGYENPEEVLPGELVDALNKKFH